MEYQRVSHSVAEWSVLAGLSRSVELQKHIQLDLMHDFILKIPGKCLRNDEVMSEGARLIG